MTTESVRQTARPGLTAAGLRWLAMGLMLLDHLCYVVVPGNEWMTMLGRLAFPIFAFQVAEGFRHTSSVRRYAKRLLIFGLISEIPLNLMLFSSPIYPFHQNVMFTLLFGLMAISGLDRARRERTLRSALRGVAMALGACLLGLVLMTDYGVKGVLTVIAFYVFHDVPWEKGGQLAAMVLIHVVLSEGRMFLIPFGADVVEFPMQGLAVLALIPIWLYNGRKGRGGRLLQYGSYLFYPVHMLLLAAFRFLA